MTQIGTGEAGSGTPGRGAGERWFRILLGVIFLAMAVEIVLLVRQNRELKARVAGLEAASRQAVPGLEVGETVGPLELPSLDGAVARLDYAETGEDTILLVFSPDCPACDANMENWKRVERNHAGGRRRIYYISTAAEDETRLFAAAHDLREPVLLGDTDSLAGYKLNYIPTTLVVGPGGVVKNVWVGQLPEDALAGG